MTVSGIEPFDAESEPVAMPRDLRRARRHRAQTEIDIYVRQLAIDKIVEFDRQDTEATGDAMGFAFEKEVKFLKDIRHEAGGDRAALELGARKLNAFASYNNRRAARRFGRLLG
jgi:hypothetical protein